MDTEANLLRRLGKAKADSENLQTQLDELMAMELAERLALELHSTNCHFSHVDQCGFGYDTDWNGPSKQEWLKKAKAALDITDAETVLKLNKILTGF